MAKKVSTYLANKNRGGLSNQKGNTYELHYGLSCLLYYLDTCRNTYDKVFLTSQSGDYVDDWLFEEPTSHKRYCQLKNYQTLYWSTRSSGHTIVSDFEAQERASDTKGELYSCYLVYSNSSCGVSRSVPTQLHNTQTVHFNYYDTLVKFIASPYIQSQLSKVVITGLYKDQIDDTARFLYCALISSTLKHVSVQDLINDAYRLSTGHLCLNIWPQNIWSLQFLQTLDHVHGLTYHFVYDKVFWNCGLMSGTLIYNPQMEVAVIQAAPFDVSSLINTIMPWII